MIPIVVPYFVVLSRTWVDYLAAGATVAVAFFAGVEIWRHWSSVRAAQRSADARVRASAYLLAQETRLIQRADERNMIHKCVRGALSLMEAAAAGSSKMRARAEEAYIAMVDLTRMQEREDPKWWGMTVFGRRVKRARLALENVAGDTLVSKGQHLLESDDDLMIKAFGVEDMLDE